MLIVQCALGSGGCFSTQPDLSMWGGRDDLAKSVNARRETAAIEPTANSEPIALFASANETVSFTFAVGGMTDRIALPELVATDFRSSDSMLDAAAVEIFRMQPVRVDTWPGWHIRYVHPNDRDSAPLDALVPYRAPIGGLPAELSPHEMYYFWADVTVPSATAPGRYEGRILLNAGGKTLGKIRVSLTVWPIILPDVADVIALVELDHRALFRTHIRRHGRPYCPPTDNWEFDAKQAELDRLLISTMCLLRRHRLSPVLPLLRPGIRITAGSKLAVDWTPYDRVVQQFIDGRAYDDHMPMRVWPLPLRTLLDHVATESDAPRSTDTGALQELLRHSVAHFSRRGWLRRAYASAPLGVASAHSTVEVVKTFAAAQPTSAVRTAVLGAAFPQDPRATGWTEFDFKQLDDFVDIWMPQAQFYDERAMARIRAGGDRTWVSVDRPPYSGSIAIAAPDAITRRIAWEAQRIKAGAVFLGSANPWPAESDAPTPTACIRSNSRCLLYPGTAFGLDEPIGSVRLKRLRQSITDARYGAALLSNGSSLWEELTAMLTPIAGTAAYRTHFADGMPLLPRPELAHFDAARQEMAEALVRMRRLGNEPKNSAEDLSAAGLSMLEDRLDSVALQFDGVRLERTSVSEPGWTLTAVATLYNASQGPLTGHFEFVAPSESCIAVDATEQMERISAFGSLRRFAEFHCLDTLPSVRPLERIVARFQPGDGAAPFVSTWKISTAVAADGTIAYVDGNLGDWPVGSVNVLDKFELITWGTPPNEDRTAAPTNDTVAFVLRDSTHLYLAINCAGGDSALGGAGARGGISYDDLVPVGEDLVEVLLDPWNAGTRSPEDLYHLVIKRSGPAMAGKGIPLRPPCGRRTTWPVDWQYAVQEGDGRWTVEIRLSLDSLETELAVDSSTVWGLNITRFDSTAQEFSTWSGARGNAYDPLALGNLVFQD